MVQITLTDTGRLQVSDLDSQTVPASGSEGISEEQARGSDGSAGTALNLNVDDIKVTFTTLLDKEVAPFRRASDVQTNRSEPGEIEQVGVDYPMWTVRGVFDATSETDMQDFGRLKHMVMTKGIKQLGYTFSSFTAGQFPYLMNYWKYGQNEKDAVSPEEVSFINVRIVRLDATQVIKQGHKIAYTLELVETN